MSQCEKCKHEIGKLTPSPQYNCYDCFDLVVKELAQLKNQLKREQECVDFYATYLSTDPGLTGFAKETVKMRGFAQS